MGIVSFFEFTNYLFHKKSKKGLSELRGNIAIIDGSNRLLKQCIGRIGSDTPLVNSKGKLTLHLYVTFVTIMGMLDHGIQPLFVFEGKDEQYLDKYITCAERRRHKESARKKCDIIENKSSREYFKYLKKCFQLTRDDYDEIKYLLDLIGIPYVVAPGEGDAQCAAISKYHKLPVITDDTDILAFGGTHIWKDFSLSDKTTHELNKQTIIDQMYIKAIEICDKHNLPHIENFTYLNFVDFCIMLGTDYTPDNIKSKISGCSNVELFELFVLNNMCVETVCNYIETKQTKIKVSNGFVNNWRKIRKKYTEYPVIHPSTIDVFMKKPQLEKLIQFLCDKNELNRDFVTHKVTGLIKDYKLFNYVCAENLNGQNNEFGSFTSYRLKYGKLHNNVECKKQKIHISDTINKLYASCVNTYVLPTEICVNTHVLPTEICVN